MKVVCVNDKNHPLSIPKEFQVESGETYTVIKAYPTVQPGIYCFELKEINLPAFTGYNGFASWRFRPFTNDDAEAERAIQELLVEIENLELC